MKNYSIGLAVICLGLSGSPALAQTASSSGYAAGVNQTVTAPFVAAVNLNLGPLAQTSGTAPSSYNLSNSVASVSQDFGLTSGLLGISEGLNTGLLTSKSTGSANAAQATATVNNLGLGVGSSILTLLNISATTIRSFSQANTVGGFDASGTTTIEGLTLGGSLLGSIVFDSSLFINPAPNTILFNAAGLSIILNEQIRFGNGITTNALNIGFTNFPIGTGLTNGNVIVASTSAFANQGVSAAVPEPATWAMMLLGFGGMGYALRRRPRVATRVRFA